MFSGRQVFGGRFTISKKNITWSFENKHTPPCMHDIHITEADSDWMQLLSDKLRSLDKNVGRDLKALEYFFRAWPLCPAERFPILCMALDAMFGDSHKATQSVVEGVRDTLQGRALSARVVVRFGKVDFTVRGSL